MPASWSPSRMGRSALPPMSARCATARPSKARSARWGCCFTTPSAAGRKECGRAQVRSSTAASAGRRPGAQAHPRERGVTGSRARARTTQSRSWRAPVPLVRGRPPIEGGPWRRTSSPRRRPAQAERGAGPVDRQCRSVSSIDKVRTGRPSSDPGTDRSHRPSGPRRRSLSAHTPSAGSRRTWVVALAAAPCRS